jgi:hypothetical protein
MFISVHICKYVDDYNFNFLKVREKPMVDLNKTQDGDLDESNNLERRDFHVFSLTVDTPGDQTFSVSLLDKSQFPKSQNYKYSSVRFILMHLINDYDMTDGVEWLNGLYEHWERDYYIE